MSDELLLGGPIPADCPYCSARGHDVCRSSVQAGLCERRIKAPGVLAVKPLPPKDQFFVAAAELCRSLQKLVEIEIADIEKRK